MAKKSFIIGAEDKKILDEAKTLIGETNRQVNSESVRHYEIRTYEGADYNSHADVAWFFLNGGKNLGIRPAGHSDLRRFNSETPILCLIEEGKIVAIAQITGFSRGGRPVSFGKTATGVSGSWRDPRPKDIISDARGE